MSDVEFNDIVTGIYRTVEDQSLWSEVLGKVAQKVGGDKGVLYSCGIAPEDGGVWVVKNIEESSIGRYVQHYAACDAWRLTAEARGILDGNIRTGDQVLPRSELYRSEWYNDFAHPLGLDHLVHFVQPVAMGGFSPVMHFSIFGGERPFDEEAVRRLAVYQPHLKQALVLRSLLDARVRVTSAEILLQTVRDPALVIDRGLRIVAVNDGGREMLRAGVFLRSEKGVLAAPSVGRELLRALNQLLPAGNDAEPCTFGAQAAGGFCTYNVTPISLEWPLGRRDHALIVVRGQGQRHADVQLLRSLYGLTAAELRVARELVAGEQVRDISEKWGISSETVRTHVKRILDKTDCRRQSDLIRLVWSSFPVR